MFFLLFSSPRIVGLTPSDGADDALYFIVNKKLA